MWTNTDWVMNGALLWLVVFAMAGAVSFWWAARRRWNGRRVTSSPTGGNRDDTYQRALTEARRVPLARWEDDGGAVRR